MRWRLDAKKLDNLVGMSNLRTTPHVTGKQLFLVILALLFALILGFGGYIVFALTAGLSGEEVIQTIVWSILAVSVLALLGLIGVAYKCKISWSSLGIVKPRLRLLHVLWQIPVLFLGILAVQITFVFLFFSGNPPETSSSSKMLPHLGAGAKIALIFATAIITPLWEELFFRGFLWSYLRGKLSIIWAVLLTAVIFALCHGIPVLLPYMISVGLCLSYLRWFHQSIWGGILLHMFINGLISLLGLLAL